MNANKIYSIIGLGSSIYVLISHFYIYNLFFQVISFALYILLIAIFWPYTIDQEFSSGTEKKIVSIVFILIIASGIAYILLIIDIGGGSIIIQKQGIFYFISYSITAALLISSVLLIIVVFFLKPESS